MKENYCILTGSKNNAGDYLIKHRALSLFENVRADRNIIDLDAWKKFDSKKLDLVNNSKALILMGGPALQEDMYPRIYPLSDNLEDIKVPIVTMGIGWKSRQGDWKDTTSYKLSKKTLKLLDKVAQGDISSSVRDYHTLNVLQTLGYSNYLMTGCPAYYDVDKVGTNFPEPTTFKTIAFSLGVSFLESPSMKKSMIDTIFKLKEDFSESEFEVVFHHSLNEDVFVNTPGGSAQHVKGHQEIASILDKNNIKYVDISGSAENLMNYYSKIDLHIGYRVHAHIFMNSISKASILISEDGRAKGVKGVIGGLVFDGYDYFRDGYLSKIMNRLLTSYDRYVVSNNIYSDVRNSLDHERKSKYIRLLNSRDSINNNFYCMKTFLKQLP